MAKKSKASVAKAMDIENYVPKRYAPRITFTEDDIKGLKDYKVGETCDITIKVKLVALRKDEYGYDMEKNSKLEGTFKVLEANNKDLDYDDDED